MTQNILRQTGGLFGKEPSSDETGCPWGTRESSSADPTIGYHPLPQPTGPYPYHRNLSDVLSKEMMKGTDKKLVFHLTGDVGGENDTRGEFAVANAMISEIQGQNPSFLYILGDIVYDYGQVGDYYSQFYQPYEFYSRPIFAIPGNHDAWLEKPDVEDPQVPSLKAFMDNFCAPRPSCRSPESGDTGRAAMTQPHCYWTLITPLVTLIGICNNVPKRGGSTELDTNQIVWLRNELINADPHKALILAMHQPPLSLGSRHKGSKYLYDLLDDLVEQARAEKKNCRIPDMVVAGHSHNYQRFTREFTKDNSSYDIPYIVIGNGGYPILDGFKTDPSVVCTDCPEKWRDDCGNITLANSDGANFGYLRLTVSRDESTNFTLQGEYLPVTPPGQRGDTKADRGLSDRFTLNLNTHVIS